MPALPLSAAESENGLGWKRPSRSSSSSPQRFTTPNLKLGDLAMPKVSQRSLSRALLKLHQFLMVCQQRWVQPFPIWESQSHTRSQGLPGKQLIHFRISGVGSFPCKTKREQDGSYHPLGWSPAPRTKGRCRARTRQGGGEERCWEQTDPPPRALCVLMAMHNLPLLPQGTCDLPKSSEGGSNRSPGYQLICVTRDPPAKLPTLGPSQGLAFPGTCLQLMSFLPRFCLKLGLSCF